MKRDASVDIQDTDPNKIQRVAELLTLSVFKNEYPTVFINKILKFLTMYDLQNLYQRLNNEMKQWWDTNDVWRQLCVINMGSRFKETKNYVIHTIPRSKNLNYKWLLFAWEWLNYFYERFTDREHSVIFDIWLPNLENDMDDRMLVSFKIILSKMSHIRVESLAGVGPDFAYFSYFVGAAKIPLRRAARLYGEDDNLKSYFKGTKNYFRFVYNIFATGHYIKMHRDSAEEVVQWFPAIKNKMP